MQRSPAGLDERRTDRLRRDRRAAPSSRRRQRVVELLAESGGIDGEPRPITHPVKFWENGSRPLEIVTNRQWFIRYPPKEELLERGRELHWHPDFMRVRYENWVNGLIGDWNITRQRFFGVPLPGLVSRSTTTATSVNDHPILARADQLPVDPSSDVPDGYDARPAGQARRVHRRPRRHGHLGDVVAHPADRRATGSTTPTCSTASSRWTFDRRRTRSSARGCSRPSCAATTSSTRCRSPTPRSRASSFDPDRKKLSKSAGNSPDDPERGHRRVRLGRRALLGRRRSSRHGRRLRPQPAEGRSPARDQAAQRVEVRAVVR